MSPLGRGSGTGRDGRGIVAGVVAATSSFLLEPAGREDERVPMAVAPAGERPVIAVFGLGRGCGTTVVARALAAELAERDPTGTAAVACELLGSGIPLATKPASRLARGLARAGSPSRAVGRLCLVHHGDDPARVADTMRALAPLVIDAGSEVLGGAPAALADRCILVTSPALEPALARVAADCVARVGARPLVALNRSVADSDDADGDEAGPQECALELLLLPDSRMGAQFALAGREARGELGRAIGALADRCG